MLCKQVLMQNASVCTVTIRKYVDGLQQQKGSEMMHDHEAHVTENVELVPWTNKLLLP